MLRRAFRHFGPELTLLDGDSGEGTVEVTGLLVGEGGLLDVDLGAVDLGIGVGGHGFGSLLLARCVSVKNEGTLRRASKAKKDCNVAVKTGALYFTVGLASVRSQQLASA